MIVSRTFRVVNILNKSTKGLQSSLSNVSRRNGHSVRMAYRSSEIATDKQRKIGEILGAISWGWVFYHCINNYELLLGEYFSPNPALWTDEELGIPPDEAGPYVPE